MSERYGQIIGGIKSQQKLLRDRIEKIESRLFILSWSLCIFYGTIFIIILKRHYGW